MKAINREREREEKRRGRHKGEKGKARDIGMEIGRSFFVDVYNSARDSFLIPSVYKSRNGAINLARE